MDTAMKHPVPDRDKPSILTSGHSYTLSPERQSAQMSKITNDVRLNTVRHGMLYSCTHMTTVDIKGLT